ncbi:MAG TPA: hypothetical protein VGF55_01770 [Gemmataceae bacterium]|jgi:hypothetical protein
MSRRAYSCAVIGGAAVAYFVIFPDDLVFPERLLALTQAVAPGAYAVLVAAVVVAGAVRIWGRRPIGPAPAERGGPT